LWSGLKPVRHAVLAVLGALVACGSPDPYRDFVPGEQGRVVRIIDGDAFVLDTGQSVRLVAIEAPAPGRRNRAPEPHADNSARLLEDLALGRVVRLYYAGLSRDRYDRALAHARTIDTAGPDLWINRELVARGAARVRIYPDTARGAEPLLAVEADARAGGIGLWSLGDYAIGRASEVAAGRRGFVIIEGVLAAPVAPSEPEAGDRRRRPPPSCVRPFLDSAVRLDVAPAAAEICRLPVGSRLQVRGYLSGGRLEVTHRLNASLLAGAGPVASAAP